MRTAKFQRLSDSAIFLFEPRSFTSAVISYDPRIANQTVISAWGAAAVEDAGDAARSDDDDSQQIPDWRAYPTLPYAD